MTSEQQVPEEAHFGQEQINSPTAGAYKAGYLAAHDAPEWRAVLTALDHALIGLMGACHCGTEHGPLLEGKCDHYELRAEVNNAIQAYEERHGKRD